MPNWSLKTTQLCLFVLLLFLMVITSLVNHSSRRAPRGIQISDSQTSSPTYSILNASQAHFLDRSEWLKACSSVRSYKGRSRLAIEQQWQHQVNGGNCDMFKGRWVYDNISHPLYDEAECPYMSDQLACQKYGRLDKEYQRWRWQPHGCDLKKWNATQMMEKLRGKRLMFVGDSLNRGQWVSMVCLVQPAIPSGKKSWSPNAAVTIFRAEDYNASIEFNWAPFLVESNCDDLVDHKLDDKIIRPDRLLKHAIHWKNADILVFNSYLWWRSQPKIKLLLDYEHGICEVATGLEAMKLALETWADWVESVVNPLTQKVFFVTMSPTHLWSREWGPKKEGNCFQETQPIDIEGYWGSGSDLDTMRLVDNILDRLEGKVQALNITQLSEYRKDGHPSIYRKFWETLTPQQLANPVSYADCTHWCLPGVHDIWNELLFNLL